MTSGLPKISVRLEPSDIAKLKMIANSKNITMSELLRSIIDKFFQGK